MKAARKIPSYWYVYAVTTLTLSGILVSAVLTTDTRWTSWHLSRLGEGGTFAAMIFNITFFVSGVIMMMLGDVVVNELRERAGNRDKKDKLALVRRFIMISGVAWMGVALFPFDKFPVVHNIFGYGMFALMMWLFATIRRYVPDAPQYLVSFGWIILIIIGAAMTAFHTIQFTSLLFVEMLGGVLMYIWLAMLSHHASRR